MYNSQSFSSRFLIAFLLITALAPFLNCGRGGVLEEVEPFPQFRGVDFAGEFRVWATGYLEKVPKDAKYESRNYIFEDRTVRLYAARGETECFHLVVSADFGNLNDVEVELRDFRGPGGAAIPAENVNLFLEYYVTTVNPSGEFGWTGEVADALVPLTEKFDLARGTCQPIFVRVEIPEDAKPGKYNAEVAVKADGAGAQKINVELEVLDFTINKYLPAVFAAVDPRIVGRWHGLDPLSDDTTGVTEDYEELLASRGVTPLLYSYPELVNRKSRDSAADEWARRVAAGREIASARMLVVPVNVGEGPQPELEEARAEYERLLKALERKKVKVPSEVYLWCYSPGGSGDPYAEEYASEGLWRTLAKEVNDWPSAPRLAAAASPLRASPPALNLKGAVKAWVAPLEDIALAPDRFYHLPAGETVLVDLTSAGADCLDARGAVVVLAAWYAYVAGSDGMVLVPPGEELYAPLNPWADDPMVAYGRYFGNGIATLFYPGRPAGVKGAVSSLRLELLQQAAEEWAYFRMLEEKRGRDYVVERIYSKLPAGLPVRGITRRTVTNSEIDALRRAAADELAGGSREGVAVTTSGVVTDRKGKPIAGAWVGDADFGTFTDITGRFELHNAARAHGYLTVIKSGYRFDEVPTSATDVRVGLFRRLRGIAKIYDFEMGVKPAYWFTGDEHDALMVSEERNFVYEGRRSVEIEFPTGRWSRVVNYYPKQKSLEEVDRIEMAFYNPNDFAVDVKIILLDDIDLDVEDQYMYPVSLPPKGWSNVSIRVRDVEKAFRYEFGRQPGGKYYLKRSYELDLGDVIGFGVGTDGLAEYGAPESDSFKIYLDDIFVLKFM